MSEDFGEKLSRWSQRKLAARRSTAVKDEADDAGRASGPSAQETAETQEAIVSGRETAAADAIQAPDENAPALPPIDELTADSDYAVFMAKNVPEAVRRAALRKLWVSDPVLANLDRLNDYDEDYSIVETVVSAVRTSYQVGKGYVDDVENELAKGEPANYEQTGGVEVAESAESPVGSAGADGRTSSDTLGDNDAVGDEMDAAPQRMGEAGSDLAQRGPADHKG